MGDRVVTTEELALAGYNYAKAVSVPWGYVLVPKGEKRRVGDLAWAWADPDCTQLGWVKVESEEIIDDGHVPVIRSAGLVQRTA